MTPRSATVFFHAPEALSDPALADRLWRVLRGEIPACQEGVPSPDPDTLEVHVSTIPASQDQWMRETVFRGAKP